MVAREPSYGICPRGGRNSIWRCRKAFAMTLHGYPAVEEYSLSDVFMLRVYEGDKIGVTAFFRNRPFIDTFFRLLTRETRTPRIFIHSCSVGAEPYSMAAAAENLGVDLEIETSDIEPKFLETARKGEYPADILTPMTEAERRWFVSAGPDRVQVKDQLRRRIKFLPPMSVLDPLPSTYDAVLAMNVLTYVGPTLQGEAISTMARSSRHLLCLTTFYPDTIKADLTAADFYPVEVNLEAIHVGWGERIKRPTEVPRPGTRDKSWMLPPYDRNAPDAEWRFCAIFRRAASESSGGQKS